MIADSIKVSRHRSPKFFMFDRGLVNQAPKPAAAESVSFQKKVAANSLQRRGGGRENFVKARDLLRRRLAQRRLRDRELGREVVVKAAGLGAASGLNVARRHRLVAHVPEQLFRRLHKRVALRRLRHPRPPLARSARRESGGGSAPPR